MYIRAYLHTQIHMCTCKHVLTSTHRPTHTNSTSTHISQGRSNAVLRTCGGETRMIANAGGFVQIRVGGKWPSTNLCGGGVYVIDSSTLDADGVSFL